jgi:hypothetical protein
MGKLVKKLMTRIATEPVAPQAPFVKAPIVVDVAKPQVIVEGLHEEPAHPGSKFNVLVVTDGGVPNIDQRVAMAGRIQQHDQSRRAMQWATGSTCPPPVSQILGEKPSEQTITLVNGSSIVLKPTVDSTFISVNFNSLENANVGSLADGINEAARGLVVNAIIAKGIEVVNREIPPPLQTPTVKLEVRSGETPLQAARRIAQERINHK